MDKLIEKRDALKAAIKSLLDEAEKFVTDSKIEEANAKIAESETKSKELETVKSLILSREKQEAEVVASVKILGPGITEADNETHMFFILSF